MDIIKLEDAFLANIGSAGGECRLHRPFFIGLNSVDYQRVCGECSTQVVNNNQMFTVYSPAKAQGNSGRYY